MIQTILLKPRAFYKDFSLRRNQNQIAILLMLAGVVRAFDRAVGKNLGDNWELGSIIAFSLLVGSLLGWLSFYIYAALVSWTSTWFGTKISTSTTIGVLAYASVPMILSLLILALQISIYGNQVFQSEILVELYSFDFFLFYGLFVLQIILSLYTFAIFIIGLAEVQNISIRKAISNALMPLVFFIGLAGIVLGVSYIVN